MQPLWGFRPQVPIALLLALFLAGCADADDIELAAAPAPAADVADVAGADAAAQDSVDVAVSPDGADGAADGDTAEAGCLPGSCDDGNPCTVGDLCVAGQCSPGAPKTCEDGNPCTANVCDPKAGGCNHPAQDGLCDDGSPCTIGDHCQNGGCVGGGAKACSDGDPCTTDSCNSADGKCNHAPIAGPCSDGNACTDGDACADGKCLGKPITCDDGSLCTLDACDPAKGCTTAAKSGPCSDGDACTKFDQCDGGVCVGKPKGTADCDDGNPCTTDGCEAKIGCTHVANSLPCDDGNACTGTDTCQGGQCVAGANSCACASDADCKAENPCLGKVFCDKSGGVAVCAIVPGTAVDCSKTPAGACTVAACEPSNGKCATSPVANGKACEDGADCTVGDACQGGQCVPGPATSCDDANPCTTDSCGKSGCVHLPSGGTPCDDDGNACTLAVCEGAVCAGKGKVACDDGNPCTTDSCDPKTGQCGQAAIEGACDADGSKCTVADSCVAGKCTPGKPLSCDDQNPCTTDQCDPQAGCTWAAVSEPCSDGNGCTVGDVCKSGQCQPGSAKGCDDNDKCTTDACDPKTGACVATPISGCTTNCATDGQCDDGKGCTQDACVNGTCASTPISGPCSDGSVCTEGDACGGGQCLGKAKVCDDGNTCTSDACDPKTGCTFTPAAIACDADGNACTVGDACVGKTCAAGPALACDDGNPCTTDACNPATGKCVSDGKGLEGDPCDADGSACTPGDACQGGVCAKGKLLGCDDSNPCTADSCQPKTGCVSVASGGTCEDGNGCTVGDACSGGKCAAGSAKACDDGDKCTIDTCDATTGSCVHKVVTGCGYACQANGECTDSNGCTDDTCKDGLCVFTPNTKPCADVDGCWQSGTCAAGKCQGGQAIECDDDNACTDDGCKGGTCVFQATTATCTDGNACTIGDACSKGKCLSGKAKACDDGNPCTDDACDVKSGACLATPNTLPCNDSNACTLAEACKGGKCQPTGMGGVVASIGKGPGFLDGAADKAEFSFPQGMARDAQGNLLVADLVNHRIRKVAPDGTVTTFAGSGTAGYNNGSALQATFNAPTAVTLDLDGNVYVADGGNHVIRKIDTKGLVTTLSGSGLVGWKDGVWNVAQFSQPTGLAWDTLGLYVADAGNHTIRLVRPDGTAQTVAGAGKAGWKDGVGTAALLDSPYGLALGPQGSVWIADAGNHRVRRLAANGTVTTMAGDGVLGYVDGAAAQARFAFPVGLAVTAAGDLLVADRQNLRVRMLTSGGQVSTVLGDGQDATLNEPFGLAADGTGLAWVVDQKNHRIRKWKLPVVACSDGNTCTVDACDAKTGQCVGTTAQDGTACGEGCFDNQSCKAGTCQGGTPKNCNDLDDCTYDACWYGACKHAPVLGCK